MCGYICTASSGLTRHFTSSHAQDFQRSFQCPVCKRDSTKTVHIVDGFSSWHMHLMTAHNEWACLGWNDSNQYLLMYPKQDTQNNTGLDWASIDPVQNRATSDQHYIYNDERQHYASTTLSISSSLSSSPNMGTATSRSSDSTVVEISDEQDGNVIEQNLHFGHGKSKAVQPSADSLCISERHTKSEPPPIPIQLVDPVLRDCRDLKDVLAEASELATDLSLNLEQLESMDVDKHHEVDCILERWNKNLFLLRWLEDGSCWWVQRKDINADLVQSFEEGYTGISLGVDKVLGTRKRHRKVEYRIRWVGCPEDEDTWVSEKQMSPELVKKHKPKAVSRSRRKY